MVVACMVVGHMFVGHWVGASMVGSGILQEEFFGSYIIVGGVVVDGLWQRFSWQFCWWWQGLSWQRCDGQHGCQTHNCQLVAWLSAASLNLDFGVCHVYAAVVGDSLFYLLLFHGAYLVPLFTVTHDNNVLLFRTTKCHAHHVTFSLIELHI